MKMRNRSSYPDSPHPGHRHQSDWIAKPYSTVFIAVNQCGACKDFIDLKFIMENTGLTLKVLLQDLSRKYTVGEEILFQLKKSLIYFEDAERDLNVNMYATDSGRFERLTDDTWRATKRYFKDMVMTGSSRV